MLVVDASIALKWFRREESSQKALEYLENHQTKKEQIAAPFLFQYELFNAIVTKTGANMYSVVKVLLDLQKLEIFFVAPSQEHVRRAAILAIEKKISFYDASYIALAHILKCDLITADDRLVKKVNLPFVKLL